MCPFSMFHQMEGLMIGEDVSFANFKAILDIIKNIQKKRKEILRFRPHTFPFTEPSAEMDVRYVCKKGYEYVKGLDGLKFLEVEW